MATSGRFELLLTGCAAALSAACIGSPIPDDPIDGGTLADGGVAHDGGSLADGGMAHDGGSLDGGIRGCDEPGRPACCPGYVDFADSNPRWTLTYPRALFGAPPDLDAGAAIGPHLAADGGLLALPVKWKGVRHLAAPVSQFCPAPFVTAPVSAPCSAELVAQFELADPGLLEILVNVPASAFSLDMAEVSFEPGQIRVSRADGVPLLVLSNLAAFSEPSATKSFTVGPLTLSADTPPFCANPVWPRRWCNYQFVAEALRVSHGAQVRRIEPTASADFATDAGTYRVTHRAIVRRVRSPNGEPECGAWIPDVYSFEVLRLGN
ncbi:MAG: hypothetical protein ACYC8T_04335 [Myxococcaceae bacterium]